MAGRYAIAHFLCSHNGVIMFAYTQADLDLQVAALSMPVQLWLNWMMVVIVLMPILFIRRPQGRIAILCSIALIATAMPISRMTGITNLLSLIHLVLWIPLVIYFCRQMRAGLIPYKSFFGVWSVTMVASCIISLVFDVRDFARWLLGERGIVSAPAEQQIPWIVFIFILISLYLAGSYVLSKAPFHNRD